MRELRKHLDAIARQAVVTYGLRDFTLRFVRHSENATFKVETPDAGTYLLRIHVPITKAMGNHGEDIDAIVSELLWLEALSQDTNLVLQKPVRNQTGGFVTQIQTEDATCPINCSLLHWVDGQPYQRGLESEHTAYQIGEILAKLHNQASQWETPEGFHRPNRDPEYFEEVLRNFKPALIDERINSSDYFELETAIAILTENLRSLKKNQQTHGLIHADAHKGNMLYHEGRIRLIDFSFCAFGNYMFDLGICFSDMKECLHRFFLAGYQDLRNLPDNFERLIEGLFIGSMVGTFSFWVANPHAQETLARKVPQIAQEYAAKFNRGEYFWFS